jgi:hypothetical protein
MGDAYLKLKEYQEAIGAYKEVIKFTSGAPVFIYRKSDETSEFIFTIFGLRLI